MHDDLYCQNVYNYFNSNTFIRLCLQNKMMMHERNFEKVISQLIQECEGPEVAKKLHSNMAV